MSGNTGLWVDTSGNLKHRNADGSDAALGGADLQVIAVKAVAASALASNVYANGTAGVGATLTASSNGALGTIDGVTMAAGDLMLVTGESTGANNGLYKITSLGGAGKYKLTRATDFDSSAEMVDGTLFMIGQGSVYADTNWKYTGASNPVVGTDSLTFALSPLSISYGAVGDMAAAGGAAANAAGVSSKVSRTDHVHALSLDGTEIKNVANAGTTAGIGLLRHITIASGANGNVDVVLDRKERIVDAWTVMAGAGTAGATLVLKNGTTNAITDTIDLSAKSAKDLTRFTTLDATYQDVASSGTLRATKASTGGDFGGCELYVLSVPVA